MRCDHSLYQGDKQNLSVKGEKGMGDAETQALKEDVTEIKDTVKSVESTVNDLRVLLAGSYVTKTEFDEYKKEEKTNRRWWAGFIITAAGVVMTIINLIFSSGRSPR